MLETLVKLLFFSSESSYLISGKFFLGAYILAPYFFHLSFVFFFSSRLAIVPHATWKLSLQSHEGCCELIGGFL